MAASSEFRQSPSGHLSNHDSFWVQNRRVATTVYRENTSSICIATVCYLRVHVYRKRSLRGQFRKQWGAEWMQTRQGCNNSVGDSSRSRSYANRSIQWCVHNAIAATVVRRQFGNLRLQLTGSFVLLFAWGRKYIADSIVLSHAFHFAWRLFLPQLVERSDPGSCHVVLIMDSSLVARDLALACFVGPISHVFAAQFGTLGMFCHIRGVHSPAAMGHRLAPPVAARSRASVQQQQQLLRACRLGFRQQLWMQARRITGHPPVAFVLLPCLHLQRWILF